MDEIHAIGGRRCEMIKVFFCNFASSPSSRFSEGTSADREIQRTLMELLNQMDGFDVLGKVGS